MRFQNRKLQRNPPIAQVSVIMDCSGFSLSQIFGPAMEILKAQSQLDTAYYPEGLHKIYVVNAPTTLSVAWNIVKGWLEPRIQKKVIFMKPAETKAKLLEAFDAENLPDFLGGTCCCEGGGCVPDPETSHDPDVEECGIIKTDVVEVKHGTKQHRKFSAVANTEVIWEFFVADKYDITLEAVFEPSDKTSAIPLDASQRTNHGSHSYTPTVDGIITFTFDNYYSWIHTKRVSFRVIGAHHHQ